MDPWSAQLCHECQSLEGTKLVVELRNDVIVRGMLDSADDYMK